MKVYEQQVQSQTLDIERLQQAYSRSKGDLNVAKGEIATLKSFQQNPEIVMKSIEECQKYKKAITLFDDNH